MIWRDNFENGTMKLVHRQADGLHLSEGSCLYFNGSGAVVIGDTRRYYSQTLNVFNNHTAEAGLAPEAINDVDSESTSGVAGFAGERYAIFPSYGPDWASGNRAGSGLSVGTNRVEVVEHGSGFIPVVAGVTASFQGRCALSYVYDNGFPKIYKDDILLRSGLRSGRLVHPTIGLGLTLTYGTFVGSAYYLYVWDHVRTPDQLLADAYRIPKPDEQGLLFAWLLDEGSGSVTNDWSTNGFHGEIEASVTWRAGLRRAGVRIVEIDLSPAGTVESSQIKWTATTPNGSGVTIETNLSLDGGQTWLGWKVCTNEGPIPDLQEGMSLENVRLKVWEHIHTVDPDVDPVLHTLAIGINEEVTTNLPPIARAGEDQEVIIGDKVILDGTGSEDPENQQLTYCWAIVEKPEGSEATLVYPLTARPHFFPDVVGDYLIRLVVNDGEFNSDPDFVLIRALPAENHIDILISQYLTAYNLISTLIVQPSKADNYVDILILTWPPHSNFVETRIVNPVLAENLVSVLLETKRFKEEYKPVGGIWEKITSTDSIWKPLLEGSSNWERLV